MVISAAGLYMHTTNCYIIGRVSVNFFNSFVKRINNSSPVNKQKINTNTFIIVIEMFILIQTLVSGLKFKHVIYITIHLVLKNHSFHISKLLENRE